MCILCAQGKWRTHLGTRRGFLKGAAATALATAGGNLFAPRPAAAQFATDPPPGSGTPGKRYVIRGGAVMSMDPQVGDFARPTSWSRATRSSLSGRTYLRAMPT
jgi:5-methylthioadenosine/S-adenosylhomocysteine deaminase